jgi:two-component system CheB/CheR fusion protein
VVTDAHPTPVIRVCGIGASAGGVEALQQFFGVLPDDVDLAYVVVLHLAPDRKSELPAIIGHSTNMPVVQVGDHDTAVLAPNTVYVIAPNCKLEMTETSLSAAPFDQPRGQRNAIDLFFRSLAAAYHDGFAVVLSGSGSDGTLGAKAVKESGGLVLVQDPSDATYGDMPTAVIASGVADIVLPVRDLAAQLVALARSQEGIVPGVRAATEAEPIPDDEERALVGVLEVLRKQTGHDFSKYKRSTLLRRLSRRMQLSHHLTITDYLRHLEALPLEVHALRDDLLITVTTFFRDPEAWTALQTHGIGPLVDQTDADEQIRVWVPGCATGEEAYSVAILFHEEFERRKGGGNLIIFASDVDEGALAVAREGVYPRAISADVSDERLERYFHPFDDHYRVANEIRNDVVFATQNVLRDPPFSRLHLISCRNLLIYLDRDLQEQVMAVFRYACRRDQAYLFLGQSEMASDELFRPLDPRHRIFAAVQLGDGDRPPLPEILAASTPNRGRGHAPLALPRSAPAEIHLAALEQAAPPTVVVDDRWNVLHLSASASRFFQQAGGPLARRLSELVRPELRDDLHAVLHRALERPTAQLSPFAMVTFNGTPHRVALLVQRHSSARDGQLYFLVSFLDAGEMETGAASLEQEPSSELVRSLREKLHQAEHRIESMRDEHFLTNEDLRAANEELQSLNEEYRSTTEELETSKEELQSINEELQTVNNELKLKVDDLSRANADLENLMVVTNVATLFLTPDLRIRRHTPTLEAIFNIRSRDYDRPIGDQTHTLNYDGLETDAREVLATSSTVVREVTSRTGQVYVLRMNPYRSARGDQVEGVVLTFIDVTELRAAQRQVAEDLRRMTRLHELGTRLASPGDLRGLLDEVLRVAVEVTAADMGNIQQVDEGGALLIAAHSGFQAPFLEFFGRVDTETDSVCATAMAARQRVIVEDVASSPIFAGSPSLQAVAAAQVRACQSTPLFDLSGRFVGMLSTHYRSRHRFESAELQWLDLLARHAASVLERDDSDRQLAKARVELEERVVERTRWLSLMHDVSRAINEVSTWDEALHQVLRCLCQGEHWQVGFVYLPDPRDPNILTPAVSYLGDEQFAEFQALSERQRYARGQSLPGRVYAENVPVWIDDPSELAEAMPVRAMATGSLGLRAAVGLPITLGQDVVAVLELISNQPHPRSDQLTALIRDVGHQIATVVERERTTARVADLIWSEQQNLLHTLHDSLGQTLTGLGMLSAGLQQRLADTDPADAEVAAQIAGQAQQALGQVRQLAKSLFPVEVDAESMMSALRDLASTTESLYKIHVRVEGQPPKGLHNGKVATELYRIAQEAVTNVIKHARARTIVIRISGRPTLLELRVADDGIGMSHNDSTDGMGLRIMRYRAASIGARLTIESAPTGGTVVTCVQRMTLGAEARSTFRGVSEC